MTHGQEDMLINIHAKPKSRRGGIFVDGDGTVTVMVKSPPDKGKANKEIIKVLADKLGIPTSRVTIVAGHKSTTKRIAISGADGAILSRLEDDKEDGA